MRRHFQLDWTMPEHYEVVLNTQRVSVAECIAEMLAFVEVACAARRFVPHASWQRGAAPLPLTSVKAASAA